jgi:hypothetical protein
MPLLRTLRVMTCDTALASHPRLTSLTVDTVATAESAQAMVATLLAVTGLRHVMMSIDNADGVMPVFAHSMDTIQTLMLESVSMTTDDQDIVFDFPAIPLMTHCLKRLRLCGEWDWHTLVGIQLPWVFDTLEVVTISCTALESADVYRILLPEIPKIRRLEALFVSIVDGWYQIPGPEHPV